MCSPLTIAMKLASSPSRNSSTTTVLPAAPNWPANISSTLAIACPVVSQITTPLPAARPSAFTTSGARCARIQAGSKFARVNVAYAAVGMRCRLRKSFVNAFDPSRRAASLRGPKQRSPAASNASVTPMTSGPSGPTMVRSIRSRFANCRSAAMSSAAMSTLVTRGSSAVPALPGATYTALTCEACATFHASACSRPPDPMMRTRIARRPSVTEMAHAGQDHRHAVRVGRGDHFRIAHRAARLDDRLDAELRGDVDAVAEREECIGGHDGAVDRQPLVARLHRRDAARDDAAHLAGADADRHAFPRINDGVRLNVFAHLPREHEIGELGGRRGPLRHDLQVGMRDHPGVARLDEESAVYAAILVAQVTRREAAGDEHAHVLLARADLERIRVDIRRDDELDELPLDDRAR